ncbi:MAG: methyltransferase domain-containing protein [Candidatus Marinimicrobia bacterium]|nr:methyltransferase domain-containing protein [Candidatus Neomarinimicrobiota bacterium]MBL7030379.1 methyltransferase domain-containing protein [Candidatus Neomarinimicrobiota bacterium]
MINPYRKKINSEYSELDTNKIRWSKTLEFIGICDKTKSGLDIGDRTSFTIELENVFGCTFKNTNIDLDTGKIKGKYDVITAFEIIEHLYNPLWCLEQIRQGLSENGRLYLSTPLGKPYFLWAPGHFHEMHQERLHSLFKRAQFRIIRQNIFRIHPTYFYFTGFRPFIRGIFEKVQIYELGILK